MFIFSFLRKMASVTNSVAAAGIAAWVYLVSLWPGIARSGLSRLPLVRMTEVNPGAGF
jgi:hypothetical protein